MQEPACASLCASMWNGVGIRAGPEGMGCSGGAFALGQPRMDCECGCAGPWHPRQVCGHPSSDLSQGSYTATGVL